MKMLIFMIFVILVIGVMIWSMRKSQAEAVLAKHKSSERRNIQRQEKITPVAHVTWPTVGLPAAGRYASRADSESDDPGEDMLAEEPSMTTIEYVPPQHMAS